MAEPIVKLDEQGQASIISYNVPEPTSYTGRFFLDLQLKQEYFRPDIGVTSSQPSTELLSVRYNDEATLKTAVIKGMKTAFSDKRLFPNLRMVNSVVRFVEDGNSRFRVISNVNVSPKLANIDPDEVTTMIQAGKRLNIYRSMFGTLTYNYLESDNSPRIPLDDNPSGTLALTVPRGDLVNIISPTSEQVLSGPSPLRINVSVVAVPLIVGGPQTGGRGNRPGLISPGDEPPRDDTVIIDVKTVTVRIGSNPPKTVNAQGGGTFDFVGNVSGQGEQRINIVASATYDEPAARPEDRVTVLIRFTDGGPGADTTKPTVNITNPAEGATFTGDYRGVLINVTGTASDNPGGSGIRDVQLTVDDDINAYSPATPNTPGNWTSWSGSKRILLPGTHTIAAKCTDNAGNTQVARVSVSVSITPTPPVTRLLLIEKYRLSTYLGNYGAGRVVSTFSLLPGEKTKISVKTYTRREETRKQASSILDSFSQESADEFENTVESEQTDKKNYEESFKWKISEHADAGWGFGSASIDAEQSGGSNSAREQFAKNVSSATQKHVSKASAGREVEINTSYEVREETGEETSIEREIENINVSRTLNFVFRQMNQEFFTILHLVDVRIGVFRQDFIVGQPEPVETYREATIPQLDSFLSGVIVNDDNGAKIRGVKEFILHQLGNIFDYKDQHHIFYEEKSFRDQTGNDIPGSRYLRIKKDYTSTYTDPATNSTFVVPGIIMSVERYVLRTEGVIVESLLGQANALDTYSHGLQNEAVKTKQLDNEKMRVAINIVKNKDTQASEIFEQVFPCCKPQVFSLWPPKDTKDENEEDDEDVQ